MEIDMMGWYGPGGWGAAGWVGMGLGMIVFWGLVIFAIVALLRWSSHPRQRGGYTQVLAADASDALQILDGRFARGDLTEVEYRHNRETLLAR
ncbi:MAG: SHOCT domain-containing protein [Ornithinibacter sp.]